jgi:hypothetical protein
MAYTINNTNCQSVLTSLKLHHQKSAPFFSFYFILFFELNEIDFNMFFQPTERPPLQSGYMTSLRCNLT